MPRTINTSNTYGAALKAIFTPPDATLPVVEEASGLSLSAAGVAVIDSTPNGIGSFSFDARGNNTVAASGFTTSTVQAGLDYPCVIFCEHIIGASPSNGGDPVFGVFFGSDKCAFIRWISSANPKYEGLVRNRISGGDDRIDIMQSPVLGSFSGVNKLALVLVSDTERYLYVQSASNSIAGTFYAGSNPSQSIDPFPVSPAFTKYGIGCAFDDAGAVFVGATAGKIGNAGFFNTSFTAPQITTFFANPAQLFTAPADTTPPNITGPSGAAGDPTSAKSVTEGTTAIHTFTANETVTWDLNGGADASFFSINPTTGALTMTARDFETPVDGGANNTYIVGVRATDTATNAATQTVTVAITNINEAPTFTGTISVPTLTEGAAMTPYATAGFFGDPDAGDTAAYSAIGSWPAGVTVNSSTGVISSTPTTPGTYAGLQVRRTDSGSLTINSNSFTITVAAAGGVTFTGTVPAKSGTVGTTFDFGSPTMASYFSGTGTYALQAGTLPPGLAVNPTTGAVTGTPTTAGTYAGIVVRKTAASGSPATADTNTFTITIAAAPVVPGFDFHTAAGLVFGAISGSLVGLAREVGVSITTLVYSRTSPFGLVVALPATATDSAGRLPRLTDAALVPGTSYRLVFVWPDGLAYTINMVAT